MPKLELIDYQLTFVARCPCPEHTILCAAGQLGMIFGCKACGHAWHVTHVTLDPATGAMSATFVPLAKPEGV